MPVVTTYVCDCCGQQSAHSTNFNAPPPAPIIGNWASAIQGALLCNDCCTAIGNAGAAVLAQRKGTRVGVTMTGG